jgi:hypothetical protein
VNWSNPGRAISVQIVQDPGGTTPGKTGKLCFVCNSENPTDQTAQNAYALWRAAVAPERDDDVRDEYLGDHYWTNAIMHGVAGGLPAELERARSCCKGVLDDQLKQLAPHIIISCGEVAAKSLHGLRLVKRRWREFNAELGTGVYKETTSIAQGHQTKIFCTYHTSAGAVNRSVSARYSAKTQKLLDATLEAHPIRTSLSDFFDRFPADSGTGRGMRVLLLHWLEIGEAIRRAHSEGAME